MIEYEYWEEGDQRPKLLPDGCETFLGGVKWATTKTKPSDWIFARRRWPKSWACHSCGGTGKANGKVWGRFLEGSSCPMCNPAGDLDMNKKETKKTMISKEMYEKCMNKDRRIYADLPTDVKAEIKKGYKQYYSLELKWKDDAGSICPNLVYRIHPDTKIEQEYEELPVVSMKMGTHYHYCITPIYLLNTAVNAVNFLGIVYTRDGVQSLRTSMDAAFGIPIMVRLAK